LPPPSPLPSPLPTPPATPPAPCVQTFVTNVNTSNACEAARGMDAGLAEGRAIPNEVECRRAAAALDLPFHRSGSFDYAAGGASDTHRTPLASLCLSLQWTSGTHTHELAGRTLTCMYPSCTPRSTHISAVTRRSAPRLPLVCGDAGPATWRLPQYAHWLIGRSRRSLQDLSWAVPPLSPVAAAAVATTTAVAAASAASTISAVAADAAVAATAAGPRHSLPWRVLSLAESFRPRELHRPRLPVHMGRVRSPLLAWPSIRPRIRPTPLAAYERSRAQHLFAM
jgi:hypothetical protein